MIIETPLWLIAHDYDVLSQDGTEAVSENEDDAWWWNEPGYFLMEEEGVLVGAHNG